MNLTTGWELKPKQIKPIPWGWTNRDNWVVKPRGEIVMPRLVDYFDWDTLEAYPVRELNVPVDEVTRCPPFITTAMKSGLTTATRFLGAEEAYIRLLETNLDLTSIFESMYEWNEKLLSKYHEHIDWFIVGDEIAGSRGMIISPQLYRNYVLPYHEALAQLAARFVIPASYHSDGDFSAVIDDILDAGFQSVHYEAIGKMATIAWPNWIEVIR
jgi:hypothetical protein